MAVSQTVQASGQMLVALWEMITGNPIEQGAWGHTADR